MIKYSKFLKEHQKLVTSFIALVSLIIASKISIDLVFSPVPITLQTLAVLLIAFLFEKRLSVIIILTYLLLGLFGFAVFAGSKVGLSAFTGATGGFLIGFLIAAYLISIINERLIKPSFLSYFILFILGHLIISIIGLGKLYFHVGDRFLELGFYPFLPGLFIKSLIGTFIIYYRERIIKLFT